MKKIARQAVLAALTATVLAPSLSFADDGLAYNVGAVSDYRFRGLAQSHLGPALQGGVDYTHGPFYVGAWASTIRWVKDAGGNTKVETDLYGGYKGEIAKDLTYDVGLIHYRYFNNDLPVSANTTELYGALTSGIFTVKYSHSVSNLFGFDSSKNSNYLEGAATIDLGSGISLTPHLGYQRVAKNSDFSYMDYALTVAKDVVPGLTLSGAIVGADTKKIDGGNAYVSPTGKNLARLGAVLGAKYTF